MNAVIYARASSEESINKQVEDCSRIAEQKGYAVMETYIDDKRNNEGLRKLLEETSAGSVIIAFAPDRLSRNSQEFIGIQKTLVERNLKLMTVMHGELHDTPTGRLVLSLLATLHDFEHNYRSECIKRGIQAKKNKGLTN